MPLYQLLLISNVHEHLSPILQKASSQKDTVNLVPNESDQEIDSVIRVLEEQNIDRLIDEALANRDEELFNDLVERKTALQQ